MYPSVKAIPWPSGLPWRVVETRILALSVPEWLHSLGHFLRHYNHQLQDSRATVTTPTGTLTLCWQPLQPRILGMLTLPTLQLTLEHDLPPPEAEQILKRLELSTRRGGG